MAASTVYTTRQGDMIDLIAYRHYGRHIPGAVEAILEINRHRGLVDYGPRLPVGLTIALPESGALPTPAEQSLITLWD
jgi:phage tail protein X